MMQRIFQAAAWLLAATIVVLSLGAYGAHRKRGDRRKRNHYAERPARRGSGVLHQPDGIDKRVLVTATPRRYRNREHLRYVAQQACLICGRKQSDPHHLRYLQPRALGRKVSDEFAVPLCRSHHRAVHRAGDEQAWWKAAGIDPVKVARQLWRQTRLNDPQEHHQPGLAARPETPSIASAPDATRESRSDQVGVGRADDGRAP